RDRTVTGVQTCALPICWAEQRGLKTEVIESSPGEEYGIKSATFTVRGENAYGILKAERGKHRLVRLSPFDSAHRRHTSFGQVIRSEERRVGKEWSCRVA